MPPFASPARSARSDARWEPRAGVLAHLALEYAKSDYEAHLWKLLAYLGRYARQPLTAVLPLTMTECRLLAEATATLVEEEARASK